MTLLDLNATWTSYPLVVVDFETTGADPQTCMPVSVACIRFEQGVEVDSMYELLNPGCDIPPDATAIHGITDEHVATCMGLASHLDEIRKISRGAVPVAYCASFDRTIMHRHGNDPECTVLDHGLSWIDPMVCIRDIDKYVSGKGRHRLVSVCERYGIELAGAHNALADARATGRLLYRLNERGLVRECPLWRLLERIDLRRRQQDAEFQAWRASQPDNGDRP